MQGSTFSGAKVADKSDAIYEANQKSSAFEQMKQFAECVTRKNSRVAALSDSEIKDLISEKYQS
jgi:hypothetical protein